MLEIISNILVRKSRLSYPQYPNPMTQLSLLNHCYVLLAGSSKNKVNIFYLEEQEKEIPVIDNEKKVTSKPVTNKSDPVLQQSQKKLNKVDANS